MCQFNWCWIIGEEIGWSNQILDWWKNGWMDEWMNGWKEGKKLTFGSANCPTDGNGHRSHSIGQSIGQSIRQSSGRCIAFYVTVAKFHPPLPFPPFLPPSTTHSPPSLSVIQRFLRILWDLLAINGDQSGILEDSLGLSGIIGLTETFLNMLHLTNFGNFAILHQFWLFYLF